MLELRNIINVAKLIIDSVDNVTFCAVGSGPDEKEIYQFSIWRTLHTRTEKESKD